MFIYFLNQICSFLCFHEWDNLSFTTVYIFPLHIFCIARLIVMSCYTLCLFWNVLISPSILRDSFVGYSNFQYNYLLSKLEIHCSMLSWFSALLTRDLIHWYFCLWIWVAVFHESFLCCLLCIVDILTMIYCERIFSSYVHFKS